MSEMEGRGASWTEERGTSDEGRRRLKAAPEASGKHSMSVGAQADRGFCLDLNPGVSEMRDWVHGFARDVIRPAAGAWDGGGRDEWVLNGTKSWVTNGGIANVHVVVASVEPALGSRGQATFVVPPGTRGLSQGQKFRKHGIRASHTAEVVLDDVRVPGRCLVGGKERLDERLARIRNGTRGGDPAAMKTFEATRPSVAAMAVGVARAALDV